MNKERIKCELCEMTYLIKQIISNISLDHYEDSIFDLLSLLDNIHVMNEEINKENF